MTYQAVDSSKLPELRGYSESGYGGKKFRFDSFPTAQQVLNFVAFKCFQQVDTSNQKELNGFLQYLKEIRELLLLGTQEGSLIIRVECRSLQILEALWEDYCTGHLNKMAQKFLITEDVLNAFGLIEVKLTTTIVEEEYRACRGYFLKGPSMYNQLYK